MCMGGGGGGSGPTGPSPSQIAREKEEARLNARREEIASEAAAKADDEFSGSPKVGSKVRDSLLIGGDETELSSSGLSITSTKKKQ